MKIRAFLAAALAIVGVGFLVSSTGFAAPYISSSESGTERIKSEEQIDSMAFMAGNVINVDGTIAGDLFCAGSTIVVSGTVEGDVLCAGSSITISGEVLGDVRAAASTVKIDGQVSGSATVGASEVVIGQDGSIGGDLVGGASVLTLDGQVGRDVLLGAEQALITGQVGRDVDAWFGAMDLDEQATISGNFSYSSEKETSVPNGVVAGEVNFTESTEAEKSQSAGMFGVASALLLVLMSGLLVFAGAVLLPRVVESVGNVSWARFGIAGIVGLTTIFITPILAVLLMITGVGFVIGYVILLLWLLLMATAPIWVGYFIGSKIMAGRTTNVLLRATVGALVLMALLLVPIINVLVFVFTIIIGVGLPLLHVPNWFAGKPYEAPSAKAPATTKKART